LPNSIKEIGLDGSIGYFDSDEHPFQLVLSEPPVRPVVGEHVWREGTSYSVSLVWPEEEMVKVLSTLKI